MSATRTLSCIVGPDMPQCRSCRRCTAAGRLRECTNGARAIKGQADSLDSGRCEAAATKSCLLQFAAKGNSRGDVQELRRRPIERRVRDRRTHWTSHQLADEYVGSGGRKPRRCRRHLPPLSKGCCGCRLSHMSLGLKGVRLPVLAPPRAVARSGRRRSVNGGQPAAAGQPREASASAWLVRGRGETVPNSRACTQKVA